MKIRFLTLILFFVQTVTLFANDAKIQTALNGTYTIGGSSPDYTTFNAAIAALSSQGINGPTVFLVRAGTYSERVSIGVISGSSAVNTITFQSQNNDSTSVILTDTSSSLPTNNFTLSLNGAAYIIFSKITIQRSGTANNAVVIDISNAAQHNQFLNCRIIGVIASANSYSNALMTSISNTTSVNFTNFSNNVFVNGSYGIYFQGQSSSTLEQGNIISGNTFSNQYSCGIYFAYQDSPDISSNTITTNSTYSSYYGICSFYCNNSLKIESNKISTAVGAGIYLHNCSGASIHPGLTSNNFVAIGGTVVSYGIYLYLSSTQNIYYNSVNIYNSNSASKALFISGLSSSNLDIRDNVFAVTNGYSFYVDQNAVSSSPIALSDYNDLYSSGSYLGYWGNSGNKATLPDWKTATGKDNNSISTLPLFTSSTDLHSSSGMLNAHAISLSSTLTPVTTDIDGQIRNSLTPDIGADEFYVEDLGVISIIAPGNGCLNVSGQVKMYLKNFSAYNFAGIIPVYYRLNGSPQINESTGTVSINSGDSILFTFSTPIVYSIVGNNTVDAGTAFTGDVNISNNAFSGYNFTVYPAAHADAGADQYICTGSSVTLTAQSGTNYSWNNGVSGIATITVSPADTTTFIVTVTDSNGCSDIDSVVVFVSNIPPPVAFFGYTSNGLLVTFADSSTHGLFYQWDFGDGNSSNMQNPQHLYASSANYTVTLIVTNNCGSDTFSLELSVVGIPDYELNSFLQIFPNPSDGSINIDLSGIGGSTAEIKIFDQIGRLYKQDYVNPHNQNKNLVISGLNRGIYYLQIRTEKGLMTGKILVQ